MATGWAPDGAVQDQIDATVADAVARARARQGQQASRERCADCDAAIPERRRIAIPGVQLCVTCQEAADRRNPPGGGHNRRGSKDSQLR